MAPNVQRPEDFHTDVGLLRATKALHKHFPCLCAPCNMEAVGIHITDRVTQISLRTAYFFSRQELPPATQLTAALHQTLTSKYPAGGSKTCSELIKQNSQGNSHSLLYCLSYLTGNNEGNTACTHCENSPASKAQPFLVIQNLRGTGMQ